MRMQSAMKRTLFEQRADMGPSLATPSQDFESCGGPGEGRRKHYRRVRQNDGGWDLMHMGDGGDSLADSVPDPLIDCCS